MVIYKIFRRPEWEHFDAQGETLGARHAVADPGDIGVRQADGSVLPGRYLGVASLEWQRPIWRNSVRTPWESVLFVDAGVVTNQTSQVDAQLGVGAGLRYNSPVGPLQVDIAYGLETRRLRLHLNVGFVF